MLFVRLSWWMGPRPQGSSWSVSHFQLSSLKISCHRCTNKTKQKESKASLPRVSSVRRHPARNLEGNLDLHPCFLPFPSWESYFLNIPWAHLLLPMSASLYAPSLWVFSLHFSQCQLLNCNLIVLFPCLIPLWPSLDWVWTLIWLSKLSFIECLQCAVPYCRHWESSSNQD